MAGCTVGGYYMSFSSCRVQHDVVMFRVDNVSTLPMGPNCISWPDDQGIPLSPQAGGGQRISNRTWPDMLFQEINPETIDGRHIPMC